MAEAINLHKRMAMKGPEQGLHLKKGGSVKVPPALDSSQKAPLPKPGGKIATMKKGGKAR